MWKYKYASRPKIIIFVKCKCDNQNQVDDGIAKLYFHKILLFLSIECEEIQIQPWYLFPYNWGGVCQPHQLVNSRNFLLGLQLNETWNLMCTNPFPPSWDKFIHGSWIAGVARLYPRHTSLVWLKTTQTLCERERERPKWNLGRKSKFNPADRGVALTAGAASTDYYYLVRRESERASEGIASQNCTVIRGFASLRVVVKLGRTTNRRARSRTNNR